MRKISKLVCKEKQLQRDIDNGKEEAKKELEKVKAEHEKLKEQIAKKFEKEKDDPQMRERALKIFNEEMAECK